MVIKIYFRDGKVKRWVGKDCENGYLSYDDYAYNAFIVRTSTKKHLYPYYLIDEIEITS